MFYGLSVRLSLLTTIFNLYCYKLEQVSSQYILQVAVILLFILVNNEINSNKKNKIT